MVVLPLRGIAIAMCGIAVLSAPFSADAGGGSLKEEIPLVEMTVPGAVGLSVEGQLEERFRVPATLRETLEHMEPGASIRVARWPVAPGDHRTVRIERRSIYADGARVFEAGDLGFRRLPRSPHIHFLGAIEDEHGSGVVLVLDPRTGRLSGTVISGGFSFDLVSADPDDAGSLRVVATTDRLASTDPIWDCGGETIHLPEINSISQSKSKVPARIKSEAGKQAVIAIDTDSELLSQKFDNNTAAAVDYIADLFATINVMYQRDLDLTLLLGTTILRTGSDPYSQDSGGSASGAELSEFGNYWKTHYQSEDRALAAMLSGKSPSSNAASGIAWVGSLCSSNYGYSFSKVFKINYLTGDAKVVGHEIGHNFGSLHTHCYNPPIDNCWSLEGGCYSGPTSCPGGAGTLMSYCHLTGCGSSLSFHPAVIDRILYDYVAPATGVCIFAQNEASNELFVDSFEDGTTDQWDEILP